MSAVAIVGEGEIQDMDVDDMTSFLDKNPSTDQNENLAIFRLINGEINALEP